MGPPAPGGDVGQRLVLGFVSVSKNLSKRFGERLSVSRPTPPRSGEPRYGARRSTRLRVSLGSPAGRYAGPGVAVASHYASHRRRASALEYSTDCTAAVKRIALRVGNLQHLVSQLRSPCSGASVGRGCAGALACQCRSDLTFWVLAHRHCGSSLLSDPTLRALDRRCRWMTGRLACRQARRSSAP